MPFRGDPSRLTWVSFSVHTFRSDLRSYLLERGIISPTSTREQLVVLAKQDYSALSKSAVSATASASSHASAAAESAYSLASSLESAVRAYAASAQSNIASDLPASASSLASQASSSVSSASKTASNAASSASKNAGSNASSLSKNVDSGASAVSKSAQSAASDASKSASSALAQATKEIQKNFDVNKDYVFSSWKELVRRKYQEGDLTPLLTRFRLFVLFHSTAPSSESGSSTTTSSSLTTRLSAMNISSWSRTTGTLPPTLRPTGRHGLTLICATGS